MDEYYERHGIRFVWDHVKERTNLAKHGVSFKQSTECFFDPFLKFFQLENESETRQKITGMDTKWNLLVIVHLSIDDGIIRIISARKATKKERLDYEN